MNQALPTIEEARLGQTHEDRLYPPGVRVWRNARNRFFVFELHYTANERKRGTEFKSVVASSMTRSAFQQEYEIQWDTFHGMPVYPDYSPLVHEALTPHRPELGLTLLRGWDFGLTPACVIAQVQGTRLVVLREFVETNMGAERFVDKVVKACRLLYPSWMDQRQDWRDFIDPAGEGRAQTDEQTCAGVMVKAGLMPIAGAITWEERRTAVEQWLVRRDRGGPCFQVNAADAPTLVKAFRGGYRYPEKASEIEPARLRPLKDFHSHVSDALQYLCTRIAWVKNVPHVNIPRMAYGPGIR